MIPRNPHTNPSQANPDVKLQGVQYERNPEAEYGEHIKNTGCICNTSASQTYGNVMALIEKFILDIFPADLFKTVTASTALASRQLNHVPRQLLKKELPIMVLSPRIVFGQGEDRFLGHTLFNDRFTNTHATWGNGSLIPLAEDPMKRLWVNGHFNRAVMYVDVVMQFNTYHEQVNWLSYIHNMIPIGHNQFVRAPLELFIPEEFCKLIGYIGGVPIEKDGSVYKFLTYMNTIWHFPITYKLKGGSNSNEFFMYYLADIDVLFQEPQVGTGIRDGQIQRGFDITFTVRCDFNTVGYFTLNNPDFKKPINISSNEDATRAIVPIFSDVINLDDFVVPLGWKILGWPIFKLGYGENSIDIRGILNQSLEVVIDHHLKFGIPMERFIKFQFRENGEILNDELFYIDWANRKLVLIHPNPRRTYRLIITVSTEYINNLIKETYNFE